jgi:hypothetical protein
MTIPISMGHGVFLMLGLLLVVCIRWRRRGRRPTPPRRRIPLDRLPDSQSLSGVPLRILLSERSGPGAMLRDMLHVRPDPGDHPRPRRGSRPPDGGHAIISADPSVALWSAAPYR